MQEEHILRIKSAMIIYALENALGNYVLNSDLPLDSKIFSDRVANSDSKHHLVEENNLKILVESSYLDEIFTYAMKTAEGTSYHEKMKDLKTFCSFMKVFDIRNAVSHPNRPFPDAYWFRSAAIASDPLVTQLGLNEVRESLNAALEEKLTPPPDEWINDLAWAIPNTLPTTFDHEITGLLGRDKEFKDLEATMAKVRNNLIAVVAPGGIGKTALILQYLKDISLNPKWTGKINSILFCSLKNEKLTAEGVEKIKAVDGIDQIKESILHDLQELYDVNENYSFEDTCESLAEERILICIDNLETLLVKSQDEFKNFNESLPLLWRVIVTSRISLDSATTVPIRPLGKRHANQLSRSYLKRRGIRDIDQTDIETISKRANYNPLAIRLTIDLYIKGNDIHNSISKSEKEIAAFSYSNLIESLSQTSIEILEAIYVSGKCSRDHLTEVLEKTQDDISESINELSKTSLIERTISESGNDRFDLSNSIRDLLLTNPRNIEIRNKIASKIKARNLKIQEQRIRNQKLNITPFDDEYIDENINASIKAAAIDLNKFLNQKKKSSSIIANLKSRFSNLALHHNSNPELLFHFSRIYGYLKDSTSELELIEKSIKFDTKNPRNIKAKGLNLFNKGNYHDANNIFRSLIDQKLDYPQNSSKNFSYSLLKLYLLSYLFQGKYSEILSFTENWKSHPYDITLGTYRASAYKRSVDGINNFEGKRENAYKLVLEVFEDIFEAQNYPALTSVEGIKIIRDLGSIFSFKSQYSKEFIEKFIFFVSKHFFEMVSVSKGESIDSEENQDFLQMLYSHDLDDKQNPLREVTWYSPNVKIQFDKEHIEELINEGYTIVEVYQIPQSRYGGMPRYMFAKDSEENEFYLNVDYYYKGWNGWGRIETDDKMGIKYDQLKTRKATKATEIISVDKFSN